MKSGTSWWAPAMLALLWTSAAPAAEIVGHDPGAVPTRGSFAGARVSLPFGGRDKARVGLAVAPMQRWRETGAIEMGRGLELGVTRRGKLEFAAGGRSLHLREGRKSGISTVGWVAIGVGTALVVGTSLFVYAMNHCDHDADEC